MKRKPYTTKTLDRAIAMRREGHKWRDIAIALGRSTANDILNTIKAHRPAEYAALIDEYGGRHRQIMDEIIRALPAGRSEIIHRSKHLPQHVDRALSTMVRRGEIVRVGRGRYDKGVAHESHASMEQRRMRTERCHRCTDRPGWREWGRS